MSAQGVITMKDVARAAGVTQPTVSMALRDDPRISPATRERIQQLAAEMGYRRNPMVSTLMAQLHGKRRDDESPVLAVLVAWPRAANEWARSEIFGEIYGGLQDRATELGYTLEHFFLEDYPSLSALNRVLRARGVAGLIISPMNSQKMEGFDWNGFCAVCVGDTFRSPRLSRVAPSQYYNARLAIQNLVAKGFERIGLVLTEGMDRTVDGAWSAALLGAGKGKNSDALCLLSAGIPREVIQKWVREFRPQAILSHEQDLLDDVDLGNALVVEMGVPPSEKSFRCGIDPNRRITGATLVDEVVAQIHRNEYGVPVRPKTVLVEGSWVEPPGGEMLTSRT